MRLYMVRQVEVFDGEHPTVKIHGIYREVDPAINVMNTHWAAGEYEDHLGKPTVEPHKISAERDGDIAIVEIVTCEEGPYWGYDMFEGTDY